MSEESKIRPTADAGSDDGRVRQLEVACLRRQMDTMSIEMLVLSNELGKVARDNDARVRIYGRLRLASLLPLTRLLEVNPPLANEV